MRILIRGAGDLATGIAYRLYKCGFEIIMTETKVPLTVRRTIAFSRAVYEGNAEVEHVTAKLTDGPEQIDDRIKKGYIPLLVDPGLKYLKEYKADVVVDAILAKKNLGTTIDAAEFVAVCVLKNCVLPVRIQTQYQPGIQHWKRSCISFPEQEKQTHQTEAVREYFHIQECAGSSASFSARKPVQR